MKSLSVSGYSPIKQHCNSNKDPSVLNYLCLCSKSCVFMCRVKNLDTDACVQTKIDV